MVVVVFICAKTRASANCPSALRTSASHPVQPLVDGLVWPTAASQNARLRRAYQLDPYISRYGQLNFTLQSLVQKSVRNLYVCG